VNKPRERGGICDLCFLLNEKPRDAVEVRISGQFNGGADGNRPATSDVTGEEPDSVK